MVIFATPDFGAAGFVVLFLLFAWVVVLAISAVGIIVGRRLLNRGSTKLGWLLVAASCFLPVFCYLAPGYLDAGNHDFERLLGSDAAITVTLMEISLPAGKQVRVEDPELLNYLSEMFRHAEPREGVPGTGYEVQFRLSTGKRVNCWIEIPRRCDQITIVFSSNTTGDPVWYAVTLSWPIPKDLDELFLALEGGERPLASAIEYRKAYELFQISGSHPPFVELDKDLQVVKIGACRLCIWHVPPIYWLSEKHDWLKPEDVPKAAVARAESLLNDLKHTRPYSDCRPLNDGANTP